MNASTNDAERPRSCLPGSLPRRSDRKPLLWRLLAKRKSRALLRPERRRPRSRAPLC
ncbi:MAG: hypothetical protein IPN34_10225 [Planctomycetes bacterium]|nr:hypothetical protein [Planctomycetota bacterium]